MTKRDAEEIIQTTEGEIPAGNHTELHALQANKIFKKDFNCLKGLEFI